MEELKERAFKKQPILDDIWWKIDSNINKYDTLKRHGKKVIEDILNHLLKFRMDKDKSVFIGATKSYQEIDTILYGLRTTANVIAKAVGFMFDIAKVISDNMDERILDENVTTFKDDKNLVTIFTQIVKYKRISDQHLKSIAIWEENIKKKLPELIMKAEVHEIHYILDQWMYIP